MLEIVFYSVLVIMSGSLFICFLRAVIGPTMSDRVVALDTFGLNMIGFIGILMMLQDTTAYAEVMLVIAVLAFLGSVALAKFIERGVVIDRDLD
ncbi:multisubunit sodium/proton antiporter MrpF subunit [Salsuginibacillus halophilus]|uniref:Multisubunit sodium/proton antiporter MrpF subunit n=1 Tax=Salsuginibacillus halophilus TaxID=517424 RepID=A0A2P8HFT2_9BACI|nr:Na(+)/H(+) antiporter subunit F1 [Salsuginibacillus halophilus]PSL45065.1 multisubunit sodium/proton antiporter MrpF subunit [Salsuginibacillus halophilus]